MRYSAASTLSGSRSSVVGRGVIVLGAEDQADGRGLAGAHPMLGGVAEVKKHLAGVGVRELADLEVDDHQATQGAMEEEQIDAIPLIIDAQPFLPADEGEVAAQLQEEGLQLPNEGFFRGRFRSIRL